MADAAPPRLGGARRLATALLAVLLLLLAQQTWLKANAETDPAAIWESRELSDDGEMWTFLYRETAAPRDGDTVVFRGTIETSPRAWNNKTIGPNNYSPMDGLVYNESMYGSTMLRLDGLPILVNGDLSGQFFANEIVTDYLTIGDITDLDIDIEYWDYNCVDCDYIEDWGLSWYDAH